MTAQDGENIRYCSPAELPGVQVLMVDRVARRWHVFHETYTVCTVLDAAAEAEVVYRGGSHQAGPGDLLLMEPGEVHANRRVTPPGTFRVLFISPAIVEEAAAALGLQSSCPHWRDVVIRQAAIFGALRRLHASLEVPATLLERESHFAACLRLLLQNYTERRHLPSAHTDPQRLEACRAFIRQHYSERLTLHQLAAISGTSRFQLVREFNKAFGLAPHAYQIHLRILRARQLLAARAPSASVAAEVGFADQSHFGRHFFRITGVTPAQYAKRVHCCIDRPVPGRVLAAVQQCA